MKSGSKDESQTADVAVDVTFPGKGCWSPAVAAALILLCAVTLFMQTRYYDLLGWDTYPIIAASRIESVGDFLGTFSEKLMDGRYGGDFYRPLLNVTFALDYALFGLRPAGYQFTNILLYACCGGAVYWLTQRAAWRGCPWAPLAALLFFLLHPSHFEVLPVPARRPELLAGLLMALALATQLSPRAIAARRPPILPAVFTLLAIASKETALVTPALVFGAVFLFARDSNWMARVKQALIAVIPHAVACGIMIAARLIVLGGMGGHGQTGAVEAHESLLDQGRALARMILLPQDPMHATWFGPWLILMLAIGLGVTGGLAILAKHKMSAKSQPDRRVLQTTLLAALWLLLVGATYATTRRTQPWYLMLLVVPSAIMVGTAVDSLVLLVCRGHLVPRIAAAPTLAFVLILVCWQACYSPVFHHYEEWTASTDASRRFLKELESRIKNATPGQVVAAPPIPRICGSDPSRPHAVRIRGAMILDGYSVQAWADLTFKDRRVHLLRKPPTDAERRETGDIFVIYR